jgi:hypothetical protein
MSVGYAYTYPRLLMKDQDMKHLLGCAAIIAAVAIATPASAQRTGPGPYAQTGTGPGVNPPGGPGPSSPLFNLPAGSPGLPGATSSWGTPTPATTYAPPGATLPAVSTQSR